MLATPVDSAKPLPNAARAMRGTLRLRIAQFIVARRDRARMQRMLRAVHELGHDGVRADMLSACGPFRR